MALLVPLGILAAYIFWQFALYGLGVLLFKIATLFIPPEGWPGIMQLPFQLVFWVFYLPALLCVTLVGASLPKVEGQ